MRDNMFLGAKASVFEKAKLLRLNQTHAEIVLWEYLKESPEGFKFRRQHPIKFYIADFYCHAFKLVIEVDGEIHNKEEVKLNDIERQAILESDGLTFIRFTNEEVLDNIEMVKDKIGAFLKKQNKQHIF